MNGSKAKALRTIAYGLKRHRKENELNDPKHRSYMAIKHRNRDGRVYAITIICTGSRHDYQSYKRRYKDWVSHGRP